MTLYLGFARASRTMRVCSLVLSSCSFAVIGCHSEGEAEHPAPAEAPAAAEPSAPGSAPAATTPPGPTEPGPTGPGPGSGSEAPSSEGSAPEAGTGGPAGGSEGRLRFITCEEPRKTVCTREYKPVCGERDTGIRCIKAPCPSSEQKTYPNGCSACADEKVSGYFPMACDAMSGAGAP